MEAFHYRYHPLTLRVEQIIASGELGKLQRLEAAMCFPLLCRPYGPHVRRCNSASRVGAGETA
jgi:predicted dehydrogenase